MFVDAHFWQKGPMAEEAQQYEKVKKENCKVKIIETKWQNPEPTK